MQNDHGEQTSGAVSRGTPSRPQSEPVAGGFFIALLVIAGTIFGGLLGQPVIGLLAGLALGAGIALVLWLRDRAKGQD